MPSIFLFEHTSLQVQLVNSFQTIHGITFLKVFPVSTDYRITCVCFSLSHIQLFMTPWTIACQAPLSMEFSRQDTGVGCHFLLQGIFPTQGSNLGLLHRRQMRYRLSYIPVTMIFKVSKDQISVNITFFISHYFPLGPSITEILPIFQ